jgi:hypothetical protein
VPEVVSMIFVEIVVPGVVRIFLVGVGDIVVVLIEEVKTRSSALGN